WGMWWIEVLATKNLITLFGFSLYRYRSFGFSRSAGTILALSLPLLHFTENLGRKRIKFPHSKS
ncbi:MAG: hypothetical protein AB2401_12950, partial [Bacillus sp. (in: firmicutes)]